MINNKVEVLSEWEEKFYCSGKEIKYPAVVKLKYLVKVPKKDVFFNRYAVFKRDQFICQYCGESLNFKTATIDHIVPKISGGKNDFTNCVTSCYTCNNSKGRRTLEEASMKLLRQPFVPKFSHIQTVGDEGIWHDSWDFYYNKY